MSLPKRVLILGAAGQLGRELQRAFAGAVELTALDRSQADLSRPEQLRAVVRSAAPDLILNAAAYTAVDRAESDRDAAMAVNAHAPGVLAEEARRIGSLLVHYSTDYVFDGSKSSPWMETDLPNPLNVYGATKLAGEEAIAAAGARHLILRTSWVYGSRGKNFLLTMLRLAAERDRLSVVDDQIGAPTSAIAIAAATRAVLDRVRAAPDSDCSGIYHMSCSGAATWCGFARAIFARAGSLLATTPELVPIPSEDYPTPAARPRNSVLSHEKLAHTFGVSLPPWGEALDAVLAQLR